MTIPAVRDLSQQELLETIQTSEQNIRDLSLPVYVSGQLPNPTPSEPISIQSGEPAPVSVAVINEQALQLEAQDGLSVRVNALDENGAIRPLRPDGSIEALQGNVISVDGRGFAPRSQAVVWLFSTPTRLGVVPVSVSGEYSATFEIGIDFELGEHTVQVNGISTSGDIRSMNLELELIAPAGPTATTTTSIADAVNAEDGAPSSDGQTPGTLWILLAVLVVGSGAISVVVVRGKRRPL